MVRKSQTPPRPSFTVTPKYIVTAALSWLVPGAGHWLLGYRIRALILAVTLLGTFWLGETVLADNWAVTREVHPIFFGLQVGNGFSAIVADIVWGVPRHVDALGEIKDDLPRYLSLGILLSSISGLLNLLVVLHILDPRTWHEAARKERGEPS